MQFLYIEAPFAAFRTFTAGWYRPTATFLTPSAAYGLLLNIAGIESRLREGDDGHDGKTPASLIRTDLPNVRLAVGVPTFRVTGAGRTTGIAEAEAFPRVQTIYQQLHNYPVGTSGKERAESCRGNKYNITPVRREFLTDVRAVIAWEGDGALQDRVQRGLRGELNENRYGVPFLGDNAFLIDRLELLATAQPVVWYDRITAASATGIRDRITRLTEQIDRAELSKTRSGLFAPEVGRASTQPPLTAWVQIPASPADTT
jgi:CRISPR-associated protein Cas5t